MSRSRRRNGQSTPKRVALPESKEVALPESKTEKFWTIGKTIFLVSGWVFGGLIYLLEAPAKINSFFAERDAAQHNLSSWFWDYSRYKGRWTNDQELRPDKNLITSDEPIADRGEVQLSIDDDGHGQFSGEIVTTRLAKANVGWSRVMLSGHIGFGGFYGEAWDIVSGEHHTIAYFRLEPTEEFGGNALRLVADRKFDWAVPSETLLWRTDAKMSDGEPGGILKIMTDLAHKAERERKKGSVEQKKP